MSKRVRELASMLEVFNLRLINFLRELNEKQSDRILAWEGFSISTVAGHISGPRHYGLRNLAKLMIDGGPIPLVTKEMLRDIANQDFDFHKDWTRDEAVRSLEKNGPETVRFIESLTDENLKAEGYLESFGGNLTVDQLIDWIMIGTSVEHLENMKRAV